MFKRRVEDSGKNTMFQFAFKIFFVHIVNIIVMVIAAVILNGIANLGLELSAETTSGIVTIVCMVLYIAMTYVEGWRRGERDHNLVLYNHMDYNRFRGLIAGAISQIPGFVCAIATIFPGVDFSVERLGRYFYINFNYMFTSLDRAIAAGTVSGFAYHICYFIPAILAPVIVGVSYHLGYKQVRILDRLVWSNPKNGKRENLR